LHCPQRALESLACFFLLLAPFSIPKKQRVRSGVSLSIRRDDISRVPYSTVSPYQSTQSPSGACTLHRPFSRLLPFLINSGSFGFLLGAPNTPAEAFWIDAFFLHKSALYHYPLPLRSCSPCFALAAAVSATAFPLRLKDFIFHCSFGVYRLGWPRHGYQKNSDCFSYIPGQHYG
jgi:hypothetical protein